MLLPFKQKPCQDCGVQFDPVCMDFDHRNPEEKVMDVGFMVVGRYAKQRILDEIAKCDLVCANCHRLRTARKQNWALLGR